MSDGARELVVTCTECQASETVLVRPNERTCFRLSHAPSCTYGQAVQAGPTAEKGYRAKHNGKAPLTLVERERKDS
jgi:hypothetical protein